jgi:ATP-dependent exoDNAse (exonuclease V) beta subunit
VSRPVIDLLDIPEMGTIEREGKRFYVTPEGNHYPSVTTVLSQYGDKSGIEKWKQRVGHEEANKILVQASRRGTGVHLLCEKYLLGQQINFKQEIPTQVALYKQLEPIMESRIQTVMGSECPLYSNRLKVAGRCDAIVKFDNVNSILDFKTARQPKNEQHIENYFLQATIYSLMVYEMFNLSVPQIVIAIAIESSDQPQLFIKNTVDYIEQAVLATKIYHATVDDK